jgi:hypothetical protein
MAGASWAAKFLSRRDKLRKDVGSINLRISPNSSAVYRFCTELALHIIKMFALSEESKVRHAKQLCERSRERDKKAKTMMMMKRPG